MRCITLFEQKDILDSVAIKIGTSDFNKLLAHTLMLFDNELVLPGNGALNCCDDISEVRPSLRDPQRLLATRATCKVGLNYWQCGSDQCRKTTANMEGGTGIARGDSGTGFVLRGAP